MTFHMAETSWHLLDTAYSASHRTPTKIILHSLIFKCLKRSKIIYNTSEKYYYQKSQNFGRSQ
jgi:hypothetical protein